MKKNKINILFKLLVVIIILLINTDVFTQTIENKKLELKDKVLNLKTIDENISVKMDEGKSPAISAILSLVLPGAGHLYAGRMDVGKYFLTAEAGLWLAIIGINYYGDAVRDDSRSFAVVHSGINTNGKDKDYFVNIGMFNNIFEYNNYRLSRGEYDKIYNINTHFWNWDFPSNRQLYDEERKKSERIYNSERIFSAGLIINRIVSAVSSFLITNTSSNLKISSGFNNFRNGKPTGLEIKITKSF